MGHIVISKELETVEKRDTATISVNVGSSQPNQQHSPSSHGAKSRRFLSCVSKSWHECVQGVSGLLPSPYAERWLRCLEQLLHNEGPLPESWRIYIAIMALCRHEVTWAVRALTFEFISAEGDRKWLSGLRFAPQKLRSLTTINNILAHRPWLLTSQHILDLTKGEGSWSISELCQALCLMTHFHAFASFLHSCLPLPPSIQMSSSSPANSLPMTPRTSPSKTLLPSSLPDSLRAPKIASEVSPITSLTSPAQQNNEEITNGTSIPPSASPTKTAVSVTSPSSPAKSSESPQNGTAASGPISIPHISKGLDEQNGSKVLGPPPAGAKREIQASPQPSKQSKNESHSSRSTACKEEMPSSLREFPHLCQDIAFSYEDFSCKSPSQIFRIWEFNWQDHGYCMMTRLLNEMGNLIDERFGAVKTLSHTAWNKNKDGSYHYRKAVWNFIQSLYGIHHDDYVYSQIDEYLTEEVQVFIKKSCCRPESIEGKIPAVLTSTKDNLPSQLVPLSIIIMEARIESELLYSLRAIIPHQRFGSLLIYSAVKVFAT